MNLDKLTDAFVAAATNGQMKGVSGAAIGVGLLAMSPALPESFEHIVQWICMAPIAAGISKTTYHTVV